MSITLAIALTLTWVAIGLLSGLWMARHGHDPLWALVALPMGPLFLPIAVERVQRRSGLVEFGSKDEPPSRLPAEDGLRVLVGIDGSPESRCALATALRLFGPNCGLLVLAEVVCFEAAEFAIRAEVDAAAKRLGALAADAEKVCETYTEVLTGAPGSTLREFAATQEMDLLVVGRRGRGLTTLLLGSVSADVIDHSPVPVLVIEPIHDHERPPPRFKARWAATDACLEASEL